MTRPRVLFAHERPAIRRIVDRVLDVHGFAPTSVAGGDDALAALEGEPWDALVVDVGLPAVPGYELCGRAKALEPAPVVVLVASVYRKTSYKRRPSRLYGADDYVEIHHLGDQLPEKLRRHLGLAGADANATANEEARVELHAEGDTRMRPSDPERLATLIVSDMVLYNGDRILGAADLEAAERSVHDDLDMANELFRQLLHAEGHPAPADDPVRAAFRRVMAEMGREGAQGG